MAETNTTATNGENTDSKATDVTTETDVIDTPNVEQLMAELAAAQAENAKTKATLDKTLKEKGELTKSLRARQTAEEQAAADKQAEDERRQQEYENAINELNQMKATQAYTPVLSSKKAIEDIIGAAGLDADHNSIALIIESEKKAAVKAAQAEWLKSRPPVNNGGGSYSEMTAEQIMAIQDRAQRRIAIAENQELFK